MSVSLAALEQKFALLDELPDSLYSAVIIHPHGELLTRTRGILQWRSALLAGRLPDMDELCWPDGEMRLVVLKRLEVLEIVQYCQGQEELTDSVMLDICEGISSAEEYYQYKPGGFVDKLAQRQKVRDRDSPFADEDGLADHVKTNSPGDTPQQDEADSKGSATRDLTQSIDQQSGASATSTSTDAANGRNTGHIEPVEMQLADRAGNSPADSDQVEPDELCSIQTAPADSHSSSPEIHTGIHPDIPTDVLEQHLQQRWQELAEHWQELQEVFAALHESAQPNHSRGWDLSRGMLAPQGWREIIEYRKRVKNNSELRALINSLGRARAISGATQEQQAEEQTSAPLEKQAEQQQQLITPRVVMETGGLERSDELARQLPSELALLGHPKLRMLWHARRAERLLMSYAYRGLSPQTRLIAEQQHSDGEQQTQSSDPGRGPIIVCLDTSGSMHGEPEQIAKALVLEALIVASREQRACYVFSFGGPQQVIEHELNLGKGGLGRLLEFLQMSFHGGTDVTTPLLMAMQRQQQQGWQQADILLVTDGRFPARAELYSRLKMMKQKQGLRVHGLLLGNWHSDAIEQICEPLHRFNLEA